MNIMKNNYLFILVFLFSKSTFSEPAGIKHIVLCWLKNAENPASLSAVIEASKQLKSIPMVSDVVVGRALSSNRDIVDDSFDVGLVINFHNSHDLEQYLIHADHVRRVKDVLAPQCQRLQVYDIAY
ncbi:MAG: hypothetical protein ACI9SC_001073 [Gammaproteobacteria bacterium]|jgi:hypothetical protein